MAAGQLFTLKELKSIVALATTHSAQQIGIRVLTLENMRRGGFQITLQGRRAGDEEPQIKDFLLFPARGTGTTDEIIDLAE